MCVALFGMLAIGVCQAQNWQQAIDYTINVELSENHQLQGTVDFVYYNNSPDTLDRLYVHLYFNAFQPNSMMDVRSRSIVDADPRVQDRIANLDESAQGYIHLSNPLEGDQALVFKEEGTVATLFLARALVGGDSTRITVDFTGQVPEQVRRSGRDNAEQIRYSMAQWYPKVAAYDEQGWHAHDYVGREFYGIWGRYEVKIVAPAYLEVAATGLLQSVVPYGKVYKNPTKGLRQWHYVAADVHDFVWAADEGYIQDSVRVASGQTLRFYYTEPVQEVWKQLQPYAARAFEQLNALLGPYPYTEYAIIQGGDGGMEYPMATLVTGNRTLESLVGVVVHEMAHSWYQSTLATNESLYAWMDEGFTTYAATRINNAIWDRPVSFSSQYQFYYAMVKGEKEERLNTWSDHFTTNSAYYLAAYAKGAIFQHQLSYIVGQQTLDNILLRYYDTWKFRHPRPIDYIRVAEKATNLQLGWYLEYFANTTQTIDYAISGVQAVGEDSTEIIIERRDVMPMPIEFLLTDTAGNTTLYYIPLQLLRGRKQEVEGAVPRKDLSAWPWTHPYYRIVIDRPLRDIQELKIDPSGRMADIDQTNQLYKAGDTRAVSTSERQYMYSGTILP